MLRQEEVIRCKRELGYNVVGVGGELYINDGYAAVFDKAIEPYLIDLSTTSATTVTASSPAVVTSITLASNPTISGLANQSLAFVQGAQVVVDVGPLQEQYVTILAMNGLVATVTLQNAHGQFGSYPVVLQGAEFAVRDIFSRLDIINSELRTAAPITAGLEKADEATFSSSDRGRRGRRNKFDDLCVQRDMARRDLASVLGVPNLWEIRGKHGGSGVAGGQMYEPY